MNLLDWVLIVLVVLYAVSGYWQGFITGVFATVGLLVGGLVGVWLAPTALGDASPSILVSLAAVFIVIVCASLGQAVLQLGGARIRDRITWQPVRALDAVGGAVLSGAAALLVAWALGVALSGSGLRGITPLVRDSKVLSEVDRILRTGAAIGERQRAQVEYSLGESVKVTSGPLSDFDGEIVDVNADAQKLKVLVDIFERQVPVELGFDQVKKLD